MKLQRTYVLLVGSLLVAGLSSCGEQQEAGKKTDSERQQATNTQATPEEKTESERQQAIKTQALPEEKTDGVKTEPFEKPMAADNPRAGQDFRAAFAAAKKKMATIERLGGAITYSDDGKTVWIVEVSFYKSKIGDTALEHLKGLTDLSLLNLANTNVTDAGLERLKGLTTLKFLSLRGTKVTDAGLSHLKRLTSLQILSLVRTNITDDGVKKLQQAFPKCVIVRKPKWVVENSDATELSISIAVPQRDSKRIIDIRRPESQFDVILTNSSDREMRLWEEWNSWGYFSLRFDVLNDKGNVAYSITKNNNRVWTANYPSWVTLKPGERFAWKVDFDRETWVMPFLKTPKSQGELNLKLRAVFEITPDADSLEHSVWTGEIKSASDEYVVRYWR